MIEPHGKGHRRFWLYGIWGQISVVIAFMGVIVWDIHHPELKEAMIEQVEYTKK